MEGPFSIAISHIRNNDIQAARKLFGVPDDGVNDSEFVDAVVSMQNGWELIAVGQHAQAAEYFFRAMPIVEHINNAKVKILVQVLSRVCLGVKKAFSGDTYGAYQLLNGTADGLGKISTFDTMYAKWASSIKADSLMLLAKVRIYMGQPSEAESLYAESILIQEKIINKLDEKDEDRTRMICMAYGTKLERAVVFSAFDMGTLGYNSAIMRMQQVEDTLGKSVELFKLMPESSIKKYYLLLVEMLPLIDNLCRIAKKVVEDRKNMSRKEISDVAALDSHLFLLRQLALEALERGQGMLYFLGQLGELANRLLNIGRKAVKKDFGVYSGVVSLVAFLVLHLTVYLTLRPTGSDAIRYFSVEVAFSLIVGFCYGALKFLPALYRFAGVSKAKSEKERSKAPEG